jgi:hypothetical protein
MSLLDRFKWFRTRSAEAKQSALRKAAQERANAARELAIDDFLFDGRLPKDAYHETGYKSAIGEGFEDDDAQPRRDW